MGPLGSLSESIKKEIDTLFNESTTTVVDVKEINCFDSNHTKQQQQRSSCDIIDKIKAHFDFIQQQLKPIDKQLDVMTGNIIPASKNKNSNWLGPTQIEFVLTELKCMTGKIGFVGALVIATKDGFKRKCGTLSLETIKALHGCLGGLQAKMIQTNHHVIGFTFCAANQAFYGDKIMPEFASVHKALTAALNELLGFQQEIITIIEG